MAHRIISYDESAWWGTTTPRRWQAEALPLALDALFNGDRGIIRAVMGAGKSILQAEIIAQLDLDRGTVVMVTVPTVHLVNQLADTLDARLGFKVKRYCTGHNDDARRGAVNVVCHGSLDRFARSLNPSDFVVWLADEAHKTEAHALLEQIRIIDPIARIGFTATPWRSNDKESISSFDCLLFDYGPAAAIADGVIVDVELMPVPGRGRHVDEITVDIAECEGEGGIVNAYDIGDAEAIASKLRAADVTAAVVHSKMTPKAIRVAVAASKSGEAKVLVHANMLSEGVDMPWLRWMVARRDVQATIRFPQEVGRVLRAFPGKRTARIYDLHNLFGRLGLTLDAALGDTPIEEKVAAAPSEEPKPPTPRVHNTTSAKIAGLPALITRLRVHLGTKYGVRFVTRPKRETFNAFTGETTINHWYNDASDKQVYLLRTLLASHGKRLPEAYKPILRQVYSGEIRVDKGQASDLITALKFLKNNPRVTWS